MEKISGIYQIKNIENNHIYIGSSRNIYKRENEHKRSLRNKKHHSIYLQRAWDKYGEENFVFEILITCDPSLLFWYEQQFLDQWKPEYNNSKNAANCTGVKHRDEVKKMQSERRKGFKHSNESKEKMRLAAVGRVPVWTGKKRPESVGIKISNAQKGKKKNYSEETRKLFSDLMRKRLLDRPRKVYNVTLISPTGESYFITDRLKEFCDSMSVPYAQILRVCNGTKKSWHSWKLFSEKESDNPKLKNASPKKERIKKYIKKNTHYLGKKCSEETKKKISLAHAQNQAQKVYDITLISPTGCKVFIHDNLKQFCIDNNLSYTKILKICSGKVKLSEGWRVDKEDKVNYKIQSPSGEVVEIKTTLLEFAIENKLSAHSLYKIVNSNRSHKGWKFLQKVS